jgi:sterol desaturase/sphingolipid hydroxylase (fatty acid hydroxylase superfamily)
MNYSDWLISHAPQIRLAAFLLAIITLFGLQKRWPRRAVPGGWRRITTNFTLVGIDTAILRVAFPLLAVDLALQVAESGGGLMRNWSPVAAIIAGMVLLDFIIYWQHRLFHAVPLFWRLHRVHHTDTGFDVSSGVRFHPLEIALSMILKLATILIFGIDPLAVLLFEILLSVGALFTHANLTIPALLQRPLSWLIVTPDMHRIHHSWHRDETDSNFGFNLSIWDRVLGSYRDQPRDGHVDMIIGLPEFREPKCQSLWALLLNPFRSADRNSPPG